MRLARLGGAAIVAAVLLIQPGFAEDQQAGPDVRKLLAVRPADLVLGRPDAPVTVIEYGSLSCSHCRDFGRDQMERLRRDWIETGRARFVFRDFPLDLVAAAESMVAHCAAKGRYLDVIEAFLAAQPDLEKPGVKGTDVIFRVAQENGLDHAATEACLRDQAALDRVNAVKKEAEDAGVNSTPTFFVNGRRVRGAVAWDEFEQVLKTESAKAGRR